ASAVTVVRSSLLAAPAPTDIYTLPLPDALPISISSLLGRRPRSAYVRTACPRRGRRARASRAARPHLPRCGTARGAAPCWRGSRSEEHTSELQSRENLVCRLLLEKKNTPAPRR